MQFTSLKDDLLLVDTVDQEQSRQESMKPALEGLHDNAMMKKEDQPEDLEATNECSRGEKDDDGKACGSEVGSGLLHARDAQLWADPAAQTEGWRGPIGYVLEDVHYDADPRE